MTTTAQPTPTTTKERRSWTARYDGTTKDERCEVRLEKRRDGSWRTYVRVTTGSGKARKHTRGATEHHADEKTARVAFERAQTVATKTGWTRREATTGGFTARPDAFDLAHLPKPGKGGRS